MTFTFAHNNFNVLDLDKSLAFYKEALGLTEVRRVAAEDGSFILVQVKDMILKEAMEEKRAQTEEMLENYGKA